MYSIAPGELLLIFTICGLLFAGPLFAFIVVLIGIRKPCPRCRARIPRRETVCPRCSRALPESWSR